MVCSNRTHYYPPPPARAPTYPQLEMHEKVQAHLHVLESELHPAVTQRNRKTVDALLYVVGEVRALMREWRDMPAVQAADWVTNDS